MPEFDVSTMESEKIIDLTAQVQDIVERSKMDDGVCIVYVPHATAAMIINENCDRDVCDDILLSLSRIVPKHAGYRHDNVDNNAAAHINSAILGPSEVLIVKDWKLVLGQWQGVMLCEFDAPRNRRVIVELLSK